MILFRNVYTNKHEENYFMKFLVLLCMITTFSKAIQLYSSQKSPLQSYSNETLCDQDFEDSLSSNEFSEQSYPFSNLSVPNHSLENEIIFQPSTLHHDAVAGRNIKKYFPSKKHRNIIKMVCDSDNLISQMTLHMNFLDNNSQEENQHDFTFKKVFASDVPKNEIVFSYPENPETVSENKTVDNENGIGEKSKDFELTVSRPYEDNESLKKDNNMNYLLLSEDYENYSHPVSKSIKKKKTETHISKKANQKSEIKKLNSGSGIESLKPLREKYLSDPVKEEKSNNKLKFWVTATSFTDDLTNSVLEKNHLLHRLHSSDDLLSMYSTPETQESNSEPGLNELNDGIISQDTDDLGLTQNNTQHLPEIDSEKEYDDEDTNQEVLNYSKKFKKYKLAKSKPISHEDEKLNHLNIQTEDTLLNDYPVNFKNQNLDKMLNKKKHKKKYKTSKSNLVSQPKMKSIIFSSRARSSDEKHQSGKTKKTLQRDKVIQNLKFILSKQGIDHHKAGIPQSKYSSVENANEAVRHLNLIKMPDKKVIKTSGNQKHKSFQKENPETESSSSLEELLSAYQHISVPFDLYDIETNNTDKDAVVRSSDLLDLTNNENYKTYIHQNDLCSKSDKYSKENKVSSFKRDVDKQLSHLSNQLEKCRVKRMTEDKGEEIREGVFLKKGIPLFFKPYQKKSGCCNKQCLGLQIMSPIGGSLIKMKDKLEPHTEINFNSKEQNNFQSNTDNLKFEVKGDVMRDIAYQRAYNRFLRDIDLIKLLDDQ